MKTIIFPTLLLIISFGLFAQDFFDHTDAFLRQNVKEGLVNYKEIKKNPEDLSVLVSQIGQFPLNNVSSTEKKSFLINAYNLLVIQQVVDNYPAEGPLKIEGFFDQHQFKVAGSMVTLNKLEKEKLMGPFPDPRLHFVLVCAAIGCPPLADFAYRPETVEKQLTERTKYILNFDPFIRVNKEEVRISKIFEWYQDDFLKDNKTVIGYIDQYRDNKIGGKSWNYYEYNWSLNEQ